jgi:molecular chaperone DnaK
LQPDEVVALGAAVQAGLVAREIPASNLPVTVGKFNREVIDVTAHGLGTLAIDADSDELVNSVIVPRNTAVPCSSTQTYLTIDDQQPQIDLRITQGDDTDPEFVQILYRRPIRIPLYPAGAPIAITIGYDASGIVTVSVRDETTGEPLELPATFSAEQNLARREVEAMVKKVAAMAVR